MCDSEQKGKQAKSKSCGKKDGIFALTSQQDSPCLYLCGAIGTALPYLCPAKHVNQAIKSLIQDGLMKSVGVSVVSFSLCSEVTEKWEIFTRLDRMRR